MFDPEQVIAAADLRRDVIGSTASELSAGLHAVTRLRAALDAFEARLLTAFVATGRHSSVEASAWLRGATRSSQREAARRVELAARLAAMPAATEALADGKLTAEHASALARAAQHCPTVVEHADALVHEAEAQPADHFERELRAWVRDHRSDGGAADFERQRAQRRLSTFTTDDGMVGIDVRLDPVAGATVKATIDRLAEQLWRADEGGARTIGLSARRADALVELCRRAGVGENDVAKHVGPTVVVVIDHQTLLGQLAAKPVCELIDGTPLPPATVRRLACEAGILPMVLDGTGQPLDVGRSRRLPTHAQRMALLVRDRSCVFPHCDRPPEWCDVHHLQPWEAAGRTDVQNLVMLCEHHHHLVHEGGWQLARAPDGTVRARAPDGTLALDEQRAESVQLALGA